MNKRLFSRLIVFFLLAILAAAIFSGIRLMHNWAEKRNTESSEELSNDLSDMQTMGPYGLQTVTYKIGNTAYVSFHVYYHHESADELWFSCGRMFLFSDVEKIVWEDPQFDIAVQFRDGKKEVFYYDGNNAWQ